MRPRLFAALLLCAAALTPALAQDDGLAALKARQASLKKKDRTAEERTRAMKARDAELQAALEDAVADLQKKGVEFEEVDLKAVIQFPKYETVAGKSADGRIVRVKNSYTDELELAVKPLGGKLFKMTWAYYKDGSYKVGEMVSRGGRLFYKGENYFDPKSVTAHREDIEAGLVKYLNSDVSAPAKP